jgi:hypothetical protein
LITTTVSAHATSTGTRLLFQVFTYIQVNVIVYIHLPTFLLFINQPLKFSNWLSRTNVLKNNMSL